MDAGLLLAHRARIFPESYVLPPCFRVKQRPDSTTVFRRTDEKAF